MQVAEPGATGRTSTPSPLVRLDDVSKRFGTLTANDGVTFDIAPGRIVALLGENGAGKTTVMNVLAGIYCPDAGSVAIDGRSLELGSPRASIASGVGMVHQNFRLVETLTGEENISLAIDGGRFWRRSRPNEAVTTLLADLGFNLNLSAESGRCRWRSQQLEILRTLAAGARILLLDEPTSVLSPLESNALFTILRNIASSGRSVVVGSHKLTEVLDVANDVIVMRQGKVIHRGGAQDRDAASLVKLIVGDRIVARNARPATAVGKSILRVDRLSVLDDFDLVAVRNVSFEVRAGELVVLVGVTGNGQSELVDAIGGMRSIAAGVIVALHSPHWRGFAYIPAEHLGTGLSPNLSIADNSILGRQREAPLQLHLAQPRRCQQPRARRRGAIWGQGRGHRTGPALVRRQYPAGAARARAHGRSGSDCCRLSGARARCCGRRSDPWRIGCPCECGSGGAHVERRTRQVVCNRNAPIGDASGADRCRSSAGPYRY